MLRRLAPTMLAIAAAACVVPGYLAIFTGVRLVDDEGYMLIALRDYGRGGLLYEQVFSLYGPAYFQLLTGALSAVGVPVTHDAGRLTTLALWIATSLLSGIAVLRFTTNLAVAIATLLLTFRVLLPLVSEPMHPGGLVCTLLAGMVVAGSWLGRPRAVPAAAAIGALVALLLLSKINVGVFALVAAGLALVPVSLDDRRGRMLTLAASLVVLALPFACMHRHLDVAAVRDHALLTAASALAVVLVSASRPPSDIGWRPPIAMLAGLGCVATISLLTELGRGNSLGGLVDGLIVTPLHMPEAFLVPLSLPAAAPWWGLAGLVGALGLITLARRWTGSSAVVGCLALLAGVGTWVIAAGPASDVLPVGLPVAWLAMAVAASAGGRRGRALLVLTAVLQSLQAYPVAGSQIGFGSFLLIPVAGVMIADGWRALEAVPRLPTRPLAPALGIAVVILAAHVSVYEFGSSFLDAYRRAVPLDLPGAQRIRVRPMDARRLKRLTALVAPCTTFVTVPGFYSLHLFSGVDPPTSMNASSWQVLFAADRQQRIVDRTATFPDPVCAVRHTLLASFWTRGGRATDSPLTRHIDAEFERKEIVEGGYEFLVRRGANSAR